MLCEWIDAQTALDWGLVNQVVPYAELDDAVATMAAKLVDKFPECMRYTKQQTNFWKDFSWHQTIGHARDWLALHYTSLEPYEGMHAFVEKRRPDHLGIRQRAVTEESSEFLWGPYTQTCPACGAKGIPAQFTYCGRCGTELQIK
jgi:1,4-dihydroxy-2-naphthoyl-CoA synthase